MGPAVALGSRGLTSACDLLVASPAWGLIDLLVALATRRLLSVPMASATCGLVDLLVVVAALAVIVPCKRLVDNVDACYGPISTVKFLL
jgi:hypothetical protein